MDLTVFLVLFPLVSAGLVLLTKNTKARAWIIRISVIVNILASVGLAVVHFATPQAPYNIDTTLIEPVFLVLEALICVAVVFYGIKHKRLAPVVLSVAQTVCMLGYELFLKTGEHTGHYAIEVDKLSVIMALIIGIVGSLICLYAISYMEEFHKHHKEYKDKSGSFLALLFVVISAMFGIIFSNELSWMLVFWEITTLASFIFIKYTGTKEAIKNAFTALNLNLIGGAAFVGTIIILGMKFEIGDMMCLLEKADNGNIWVLLSLLLLAVAGISKAAQFPFSKWLLGAMVAPTPTSALLHSSTMVKAGVFLLIKISPLLSGTIVGILIILIGALTFLFASILAIAQTDAKKTLANSTIANLGLIVACSGMGGYEALWAAIFLLIFHAIAKSLLFLCVGSIEHQTGSRDIEDMHGLIVKLPLLSLFMVIGIAGMFLAPFGMLISKWATLKAFVDAKNILVVVVLVFGSAATLFYWTKWLGNIIVVLPKSEKIKHKLHRDVGVTFWTLGILTMLVCLMFPTVSTHMIVPYLTEVLGLTELTVIASGNQIIMMIMMGMIVILPLVLHFISAKDDRITSAYMGGVNAGDGRHFIDAQGNKKRMYLSNWYMPDIINERKITFYCTMASALGLFACLAILIGGIAI